MKLIKLEFLTEKGKEAYKEISSIKQSLKERLIVNKIFREKIIDKDNIKIEVKIPWLADKLELDEKIIETMTMKGCERDLDYVMEVE